MDRGMGNVRSLPQQSGKMDKKVPPVPNKEQSMNQRKNEKNSSIKDNRSAEKSREDPRFRKPADSPDRLREPAQSHHMSTPVMSQAPHYHTISFGLNSSSHPQILQLFENLKRLHPMDKYGSMSGDCDYETTQMEDFLKDVFGFKNLKKKYIVQGVNAFELTRPVENMHPATVIDFPKAKGKPFTMTADELRHWQRSYVAYADKDIPGMTKNFLQKALQGHSDYGEEAFRMKFVVRVSQCPILMEFDAKVIPREPLETWPHNIKLVSVTGIDFAGRIHDVNDIRTYVSNWEQVYENDPKSNLPVVYNGRDFRRKLNSPNGKLDEQRVFYDLKCMARLRLRACNSEKVQVVVETGIGLGVFAGKHIGIDEKVRAFSAKAIRTVLQEEQASFPHIHAVVFALPIFETIPSNGERHDTFHAFASEFRSYQGRIPVLIADQDMHRLTVAIAREGFIVSELNPADSHGVFGEYWQNRGPAVEEKLALTTVGLLVQHHLVNPYVLNPEHYRLI